MLSFKRKRILRERNEALGQRVDAAKAFVAAIREAEEALTNLRDANDRFYRSDRAAENAALCSLRRERERVFVYHATREMAAEAPHFARMLGVSVFVTGAMPLVEFIEHTNTADLSAVENG